MPRPYQKGTRPTETSDLLALTLRERMTMVERILWSVLRGNQMDGFRFRRQHAIGPYVADFYCHEAALVVEIDGDWHDFADQRHHDRVRDAWMRERNIETLRVSARSVTYNRSAVIAIIREVLVVRAGQSRSVRRVTPVATSPAGVGGGGRLNAPPLQAAGSSPASSPQCRAVRRSASPRSAPRCDR